MSQYPQHIADKANEMLTKGAKMSFEAICEMYVKSEAKAAKKQNSKKEAAKWSQRTNVENAISNNIFTRDITEINKENAMNNLPSSLR